MAGPSELLSTGRYLPVDGDREVDLSLVVAVSDTLRRIVLGSDAGDPGGSNGGGREVVGSSANTRSGGGALTARREIRRQRSGSDSGAGACCDWNVMHVLYISTVDLKFNNHRADRSSCKCASA